MTTDSKSGAAYLIDPLNEPEPSQETGPGSHFGNVMAAPKPASPTSSSNPYRKSSVSSGSNNAHSRQASREFHNSPTGSPKQFPQYREAAFGDLNQGHSRDGSGANSPNHDQAAGRRRGSSLKERFPGDKSHKPLDIIRRDSKKANRSPHLQRRHIPGPDLVDRLDPIGTPYHHEGPYDAALLARNTSFESSPVAAVADSNREALKATPAENIKDALEKHRPLEGTATVPPGERDQLGRVYNYEEGTDMMRDPSAPGGPYKQWPGIDYAKDDLDGQGEPAFSLNKALKSHKIHERNFDGNPGIEMSDRPLMSDYDKLKDSKELDQRDPVEIAGGQSSYAAMEQQVDPETHISGRSDNHKDVQSHIGRTSSLRRVGEGLKKRMSIKKKFKEIHDGEVFDD